MKRFVSTSFFFLLVFAAFGQIGNEWIQYSQPYFKIPVSENAIFRISYSALQQAGFPVSADPRKFQLFHRGKEQAIYVAGESDGVFGSTDFIDFYGRKNDGTLDSTLYEVPAHQPHEYYNLYSDTTAYFLTLGNSAGKRMAMVTGSSGSLVAETFHFAERLLVLKDQYSAGVDYGSIQKTIFDQGEGWMGAQILHGQETSYTVDGITNASTSSGNPILEVALTGRGPMAHSVELYAGSRLIKAINFEGYATHKDVSQLEWADIDATGKLLVRIRVPGTTGADRVSTNYIRIVFPQAITAPTNNQTLILQANEMNTSLLRISNPPGGLRVFDITDPGSPAQLQGQLTPSFDVVIPSTAIQRKLFATTTVVAASGIRRARFRQINPSSHNYIIVTHPSLRKPALGYIDPVKAFAEYRSLPEGGNFDTLIVNIDQLYDQFNYGEASPRAIYQFLKFFGSVRLPDYLFLIGKGLDVNYGYRRNTSVFNAYKDLVPTAGYPASDAAFSAGLRGTPHAPGIATGRLTAMTSAEVAAYLNKIRERDALPFTDLNRKKILHLSGGIEEGEPARFRDILRQFQTVAEDHYLGGSVQAIAKRSTEVKLINIAEEVNAGLGLITFFGHSAPNTLDFDIGLVTDPIMGYKNAGKYPFLLMNGCDAGSFFLNGSIIGENWIATPGKGAIGFIAHSSYGLVHSLQRYSSLFYDVAFGDSIFIKRGVGLVQQEVAKRYVERFGTSPVAVSQIQQMVLLGDPAIKVFGAERPDYSIEAPGIHVTSFGHEPVTALLDSFQILIPVKNTGIARDGNLRLNIKREFNNGHVLEYDTIIPGILYADTIRTTIRNSTRNVYGINRFVISVDADDLVPELDESNNTVSFEYFLPLNSTRNLYPYDFAIVNSRDVGLSFQYTDLLSPARAFDIEIDTVNTFDSNFKQQFTVTATVLGRHAVELLTQDSVVYYWRTRIAAPLENESKEWDKSSFVYIDGGQDGWAQTAFPQFEANEADGLVQDPQMRRIEFEETVSDIAVRTFSTSAGKPQDSVSFRINRVEFNLMHEGGACRNNTINLIAFDRRSTQPYAGLYFKWYEAGRRLLCGREPYVINNFQPHELITGNGDDLQQYIDNIASGDSVVIFNIGDAGFEQWPEVARNKLAMVGVSTTQLSALRNGDAVVIFGRKGSAAGTAQVYHEASSQPLHLERTIEGRFTSGSLSSGMIGPAQRWDRFLCRVTEKEPQDNFKFTVIGNRNNDVQDTLKTDLLDGDDLSFIDAQIYPRIKIIFEAEDQVNLTAVQVPQWLVLFQPVAEGLVLYNDTSEEITVSEGEVFSRKFRFVNISNQTFPDSLTVRYDLVNTLASTPSPAAIRISAPAPFDTTAFSLEFNTLAKDGLNDIEVFVNPRVTPERTFDNNFLQLENRVNVLTDHTDPVIDVTFDGRYIENDEFVPESPHIAIRVWDENRFLLRRDTVGVALFLGYPCDSDACTLQQLFFSEEQISWEPATATSDFIIHVTPAPLLPGRYTLRIVAADASGNASEEPYEINFRVESDASALVTPPYPNPFFLNTQIDVVLTGTVDMSTSWNFSVSTPDGRIVSEFGSNAPLHIGKNTLVWEGRATDGRMLPNGLYVYRLSVRRDGEEKQYSGKVVIVR